MLVRGWPNGGSDVFCYSIVLPDVVKSVYEKQGGKKIHFLLLHVRSSPTLCFFIVYTVSPHRLHTCSMSEKKPN